MTLTAEAGLSIKRRRMVCLLNLQAHHLDQVRAFPDSFQDLLYLVSLDRKLTTLCIDAGFWLPIDASPEHIEQFVLSLIDRFPDIHLILNDNTTRINMKRILQALPETFTGHLDIWTSEDIVGPTSEGAYASFIEAYPDNPKVRFIHSWLSHLPQLPLVYPPESEGIHTHRTMPGTCFVRTPRHMFRFEDSWNDLDERTDFGICNSDYNSDGSDSEGTAYVL